MYFIIIIIIIAQSLLTRAVNYSKWAAFFEKFKIIEK